MSEDARTSRSDTPVVDAAEQDPDVDELSAEGEREAEHRTKDGAARPETD